MKVLPSNVIHRWDWSNANLTSGGGGYFLSNTHAAEGMNATVAMNSLRSEPRALDV